MCITQNDTVLHKVTSWNPFRKPDPPRLIKRVELLELRCTDTEDSLEKILYQQSKLLGKINARHKKQLEEAQIALEGVDDLPPAVAQSNGLQLPHGDLKAHLRQRAAQLRGR